MPARGPRTLTPGSPGGDASQMRNVDMDAQAYAQRFGYVARYGAALLDLLDVPPGAKVLDLGCGNGDLTATMKDRGLSPLGIDGSSEQVQAARTRHPDIPFMHADAAEFELDTPADAVFSNAAMHWIPAERQEAMIRCVNRALRPGGILVFEMGGKGNNACIHDALREASVRHGLEYTIPFCFPSPAEYATLLEDNGFRVEYLEYFERPTPLEGEDAMDKWLDMFARGLRDLPEDLSLAIRSEAMISLRATLHAGATWTLDYMRLRVKARKMTECPAS